MTLGNETPFEALLYGLALPTGDEALGLAVKGTWDVVGRGRCERAAVQDPVQTAPEYAGEPGASSLLRPADTGLPKPGTDCLLVADAVAPRPGSRVVTVRFRVGPVQTTLLAFGERRWERTFGVARPGDPAPFDRLPLVWEHAFGGADGSPEREGDREGSEANPVGVGFRARRSARTLDETPPPRLERYDALVASPADRPPPAGTLPVAPGWAPRLARAGTYDHAWRRDRAPLLPDDFDPRFACVAPDDLVAVPPLVGGEPVRVEGVDPDGPLAFDLPRVPLAARALLPTHQREVPLSLATVVVEPPAARLTMTWTGVLDLAEPPLRVRLWQP